MDEGASGESAVMVGDQLMSHEQYASHKKGQVEGLYSTFAAMRDRWVQHRAQSGVEKRWREATKLYFGDREENSSSEMESTLKNGPPARTATDGNRSRVVVNIVRPKVDQAVARMCEILFPVDDRNWAIKPTPIPETVDRVGNQAPTVDPATGQPTGLTADQEAQAVIQAAKEAAEAMERCIDDELTESMYNGESRKMVEDGVRLGTGVIKGPFPTRRTAKVWMPNDDGTQTMIIDAQTCPASMRVDPWDVFFDPSCGNDHQRGRGVWHRRFATRKDLRSLVDIDGYDTDAIRSILREEPKRVRVAEGRITRELIKEDSYELWEYHGEIEPEDLESLSEKGNGDPIKDVDFAVLVMVNDKIIGAMQSWVGDKSLPYDVWCWRKADDAPYGYGMPDELNHQQRVINGAWRQVMDNARVSLGGQIVVKKGQIIPANGSHEITPNKLWYAKDEQSDVRQAFAVFEFQSHVQELLSIAQAAMSFADVESSMPQIMGGEQGSAPETVGGMVMLYNNANAVLRQRVKLYDDGVTRPHIGRYYDWEMANNPDPKIKGDFDVDARGSTALVERDIQNQAMINLANITNNPRYVPHLKEREELKAILKAFKINPDELMKPEDQVAQEQAQQGQAPQDPRIVSAQMNMDAKKLDLEDRQKQRDFDGQRNQSEAEFRERQLQYNAQREQGEYEIAQTSSEIQRDTALLREQNAATMSREALASKERLGTLKIESDRQIFNAEASIKVRQGSGI